MRASGAPNRFVEYMTFTDKLFVSSEVIMYGHRHYDIKIDYNRYLSDDKA